MDLGISCRWRISWVQEHLSPGLCVQRDGPAGTGCVVAPWSPLKTFTPRKKKCPWLVKLHDNPFLEGKNHFSISAHGSHVWRTSPGTVWAGPAGTLSFRIWDLFPDQCDGPHTEDRILRLSRWCRHPILLLGSEKPSDLSAKLCHIHPFYYQNKCRSRLFYFGSWIQIDYATCLTFKVTFS